MPVADSMSILCGVDWCAVNTSSSMVSGLSLIMGTGMLLIRLNATVFLLATGISCLLPGFLLKHMMSYDGESTGLGESTKQPDSVEKDLSGVGLLDVSGVSPHVNDSFLLGVALPVLSSLKLRVRFVIGELTRPHLLVADGKFCVVLLVASVRRAKLVG